MSGNAADLFLLGQKTPAEAAVLFRQDDVGPGPRRRQRGHKSGWPGPDDQQVAMREGFLIVLVVVLPRQPAQTRRAADDRLVEPLPRTGAAT